MLGNLNPFQARSIPATQKVKKQMDITPHFNADLIIKVFPAGNVE
jgi:hypothetical protein